MKLLHWLRDSKDNLMWYKHGGEATVLAYEKSIPLQNNYMLTFTFVKRLLSRRKEPSLFTRIYQHEWRYLWIFPKLFYWDRTLGNCTVFRPKNKPNDLLYPKRLTLYDEIYRPYPVTRIGETEPVQKLVSGDTGAAFKGPLSILDVDTKECWQSEP
jgi:serine/threonine protein phosphatase 1